MTSKLILCDCLGSQSPDADKISAATGLDCAGTLTDACGAQVEQTARLMQDGDVMIACQQMAGLFTDLAAEISAETPAFVDIRDRSGWSDNAGREHPKTAALVAEALLASPAEKSIDIVSEGVCLITGPAETALAAAKELSASLSVTVLLDAPQPVDHGQAYDAVVGTISRASGALGNFSLRIDGFRRMVQGGRGEARWSEARDGAMTECDILLDLSGDAPRFSAHEKRDGYLRADPRNPSDVAHVLAEAAQLTGTFEKPLYVRLEESLCAHSRAEKPACSKCLNVCPTGAITSAGEHVAIDPLICAGCGACSALCPSGAISYDAPPVATVYTRLNTLASTFRNSGGNAPRLLVHDSYGNGGETKGGPG